MATTNDPPSAKNELGFAGFHQQFTEVNGLKLCSYTNIVAETGLATFKQKTLLVLLHGYPQSPYLWRHIAPQLAAAGYPLFIPDLPGYGNSPDRNQSLPQDKLTVGTTLLESLKQHLSTVPHGAEGKQDIILVTHDRGSRVTHRLAVSQPLSSKFTLKAVALMDIVPTSEQFAGMGRAEVARGYFHWAMLPNVEVATKMIMGLGGGNWARDMVGKMTGNADTRKAVDVYASHFDDEDIVRASCRDYEAAVAVDVPAQTQDQEKGLKVKIPILVFWSQKGLGSWFDVEAVWRRWIGEGVDAQFCPVGEDAGHYLPEDAHQTVGKRLLDWLEQVDQ